MFQETGWENFDADKKNGDDDERERPPVPLVNRC